MPEPFTLRVFVPTGDPDGLKIVDRMNWTGRGFDIPRDSLGMVKTRTDLAGPGIYVLVGHEQDELGNEFPVAYVGQAEDVRLRLGQHEAGKDFWDRAMVFISASNGLNRAHITWLEWALMARAQAAGRCKLLNGLTHTEPSLIESEKADVRSFFGELLRMMPVMGLHIFEEAKIEHATTSAQSKPFGPTTPDVIVVPAKPDGFQRAFINSQAWWAIRVAAKHRPNLRWIAAYQTQPISAVTHIAEIDRFEPYGDEGKFKVVFKAPAQPLAHPIPFGNATGGAMQGPRYCRKETLDSASTVADLVR